MRVSTLGGLVLSTALAVGTCSAGIDFSISSMDIETVSGVSYVNTYFDAVQDPTPAAQSFSLRVEHWRAGQLISTVLDVTMTLTQQTNCPTIGACSGTCKVAFDNGTKVGSCIIRTSCLCKISGKKPAALDVLIGGDELRATLTPGSGVFDPDMSNNVMTLVHS